MTHPEYKIIIKDVSSKITNPREELMKDSKIRKPFIFKGYTSEEDRIKDVVYNNRLLYNLPDYPDFHSHRLNKEKTPIQDNITYNFNISLPKRLKTINSGDDINKSINKDNNNIILTDKNDNENNNNNDTKNSFFKYKYNFGSLRKLSEAEKNKYNDLIKKNLICQPEMRFTARTDLERVFDNLNLKSLKEKDRQVIEKQLTNIELYKYKKPKELLKIQNKKNKEEDEIKIEDKKYNILPNPIIEEQKKEDEKVKKENLLYGNRNIYYEPKNNNNKLWARKENLNNEAKKFLSSYHYKTHFKATEEAQFNFKKKPPSQSVDKELNTYLMIPNIFNTEGNDLSYKNLKNNKNKYSYDFDYDALDRKKDIFHFGQDLYKDDQEENQIKDYNELTKIYHNNPIFENVKRKPNYESLKKLSKIAFKKYEKEESEDENKSEDFEEKSALGINDRYNRENKNNLVDYDNIHSTAKTILGECKIYSSKSKYNNSFLKSRAGKTMITKGLSINDFLKKHSLHE